MPDREHPLECQWGDINAIDKSLSALRFAGLGPGNLGFDTLWSVRGKLFGQMGFRRPTVPAIIKYIARLSPGSIRLWHTGERGFMTESRDKPGAPPVYHQVSDQVAIAILEEELTHELEQALMTPDEHLGN